MAQSARAAVNQHDDLILSKTKSCGGIFIENVFNILHFQKMISAAESSKLRAASLLRAIGNFARVGAIHLSGFFAEFDVRRFAVSMSRPSMPSQFPTRYPNPESCTESALANQRRWAHREKVDSQVHAYFSAPASRCKLRSEQTHAAINIKAHAARRNHAVAHACGRNSANWKSVALMNIRHGQRASNNSRQGTRRSWPARWKDRRELLRVIFHRRRSARQCACLRADFAARASGNDPVSAIYFFRLPRMLAPRL